MGKSISHVYPFLYKVVKDSKEDRKLLNQWGMCELDYTAVVQIQGLVCLQQIKLRSQVLKSL